jgi:hypothetical protein
MCTKVSYPNSKRAKQAAYAIKARGSINAREALYPYYCKQCQAFHLSKMTYEQWFHKLK